MRVLSVQSKKLLFIVKMIVHSLKIIGLAPFGMPIKTSTEIKPSNSRVEAFESSKLGCAYNVLLVMLVLLGFALEVPFIFDSLETERDSMFDSISNIITQLEVILCDFTACIILISWGLQQEAAASIMNRLLEIDLGLSTFEKQAFDKRGLIFFIIHVIINSCLWFNFWYTELLDYHTLVWFMRSVLLSLPKCIIYWYIIEYSAVASIVANDLETVNKYLTDFKEIGNQVYILPFRARRPATAVLKPIGGRELASRKLSCYYHIRRRLSELCGDIGGFFSLPILFCIAFSFIPFFNALCTIYRFTHDRDAEFSTTSEAVPFLLEFILMNAYPVSILALNVTRIVREAQLTRQIVDKLLDISVRPEMMSKLELFSRQLLHENISFTAYGFFSLDSGLLLSLLGSSVTYFIVMMQFPKAVEICVTTSQCHPSQPQNNTLQNIIL